jgi:superfamily I DNA/RNA helicase
VAVAVRAGANGHRPSSPGPDSAEKDGAGKDGAADRDGPDLDEQIVVLTVSQAKGLEFDSVLIADPAQILGESPRGLSDLYVAMTRATQRLGVVHPGPVPEVLHRLACRP